MINSKRKEMNYSNNINSIIIKNISLRRPYQEIILILIMNYSIKYNKKCGRSQVLASLERSKTLINLMKRQNIMVYF